MNGCRVEKLGEVCDFIGGSQPPKSTFVYDLSEVDAKDYVRLIQIRDYKSDRHIVYILKSSTKKFCTKDDVMIGRYGPPVFQILKGLEGAVPKNKDLDKDYLFRFLESPEVQKYIIKLSERAAGQTGVNKPALHNYPILVPPIPEQKRIVAILDQAFADIDKARANAEQNLKNARELYLSKKSDIFDDLQSVATLMPLASVCDEIFAGGDAPKKGLFSKTKTEQYQIPIYANAVKRNGLYGFADYSRANKPSITIAARGSGTGHIELRREPFLPIVRLIVLIPDEKNISLEYLKHALKNLDILRSGSAIPQLTVPMIKEYSIPLPSFDVQQSVIDELESLGDYIAQVKNIYEQKIILLEELKKSILQKAFTGELTRADNETESKGAAA